MSTPQKFKVRDQPFVPIINLGWEGWMVVNEKDPRRAVCLVSFPIGDEAIKGHKKILAQHIADALTHYDQVLHSGDQP